MRLADSADPVPLSELRRRALQRGPGASVGIVRHGAFGKKPCQVESKFFFPDWLVEQNRIAQLCCHLLNVSFVGCRPPLI